MVLRGQTGSLMFKVHADGHVDGHVDGPGVDAAAPKELHHTAVYHSKPLAIANVVGQPLHFSNP